MRSVSARVLGKKEGERATSKEETTMISPRKRERIGIRPPKMRNEKKKKKKNEGQPRARFLPFSKKKNASRLARRKKDLPSSALVVVVVVSSKRFVCFVEILSLQ